MIVWNEVWDNEFIIMVLRDRVCQELLLMLSAA